jgi:hypothetical protein
LCREIEIGRVVAETVAIGAKREQTVVAWHQSGKCTDKSSQWQLRESYREHSLKAAVLPEKATERVPQCSPHPVGKPQ